MLESVSPGLWSSSATLQDFFAAWTTSANKCGRLNAAKEFTTLGTCQEGSVSVGLEGRNTGGTDFFDSVKRACAHSGPPYIDLLGD